MADVHTPEIRSYNMSRIRAVNTKPEAIVRKYLFSHGFRYRKNVKGLPGKPDIVLPKYHTVIFVNGCFWHKHEGCRYFVWPKSNEAFWREKIGRTVLRDQEVTQRLIRMGWHVMTIWECQLKPETRESTLADIAQMLRVGREEMT